MDIKSDLYLKPSSHSCVWSHNCLCFWKLMVLSYSYWFICVYMCRVHGTCVTIRGQFGGVSFLFHHVVLGDQTQIIRLDGKWLNLLNYFTGPRKWNHFNTYCILSQWRLNVKSILQRIRSKRNTNLKDNIIISQLVSNNIDFEMISTISNSKTVFFCLKTSKRGQ